MPDRPVSALPSTTARLLAFLAILLAGVCGAVIGSSLVGVQCDGACAGPKGLGAVIGAAGAAAGVAVVAVLTLRAMGEWKQLSDDQLEGRDAPAQPEG